MLENGQFHTLNGVCAPRAQQSGSMPCWSKDRMQALTQRASSPHLFTVHSKSHNRGCRRVHASAGAAQDMQPKLKTLKAVPITPENFKPFGQ
eukprot:747904-Pelagomonas_calceolata.AAC.1